VGRCKLNSNKINCKLDVCCFECSEREDSKCKNLNDRCFTKDTLKESILRGYPRSCTLYEKQ
jgi:hypothetical protein